MIKIVWRCFKLLCWSFVGLIAAAALYAGIAYGVMLFPANPEAGNPKEGEALITAYVISSGVHTDLVFPTRSEYMDWTRFFPLQHFRGLQRVPDYVATGWGDREFYLNTPQWSDLTLGRALDALFGSDASLVHVTYLYTNWLPEERFVLHLTPNQYRELIDHVTATLVFDANRPVNLADSGYSGNDTFYEAHGSYDLVTTCNTWTGDALKRAGVTVSPWTPFAPNVVYHLEQAQSLVANP